MSKWLHYVNSRIKFDAHRQDRARDARRRSRRANWRKPSFSFLDIAAITIVIGVIAAAVFLLNLV